MIPAEISNPALRPPAAPARKLVPRHPAWVRITHWVNVFCFSLLLMTGAQIFNAYPRLHWGDYGADHDHAWLAIESRRSNQGLQGVLHLGSLGVPTTGLLGASMDDGQSTSRAFPAWLTIPSYQDLAAGRRWHIFFAWLFVVNGAVYLLGGILSKHFANRFITKRGELSPRHLLHEMGEHAKLNFPKGEAARQYNALQKLTYMAVCFVLLPLMVLTGWTMSPGLDAPFHFLLDVFGGRPSARSIHFICASLLVVFVVVHVVMVLLSGVWNNMRSMVTGRYAIDVSGDRK